MCARGRLSSSAMATTSQTVTDEDNEKSNCEVINRDEIFSISPASVHSTITDSPAVKNEESDRPTALESTTSHPAANETPTIKPDLPNFQFNTPSITSPYGSHLFPLPHR